jgi:hypothetical protein
VRKQGGGEDPQKFSRRIYIGYRNYIGAAVGKNYKLYISIEFMPMTEAEREYTTIYVSRQTRKILAKLKLEYDLRSYDEVIKMLLRRAGYAD